MTFMLVFLTDKVMPCLGFRGWLWRLWDLGGRDTSV